MIIYEFSTHTFRDDISFSIRELEVEEKPKTYIGKGFRINKDDIDRLSNHYGNYMYRLDNDPKPYIEAMIKLNEGRVEACENHLVEAKKRLARLEGMRKEIENG